MSGFTPRELREWGREHGYIHRCPVCGAGPSDSPGPCSDRCELVLAQETHTCDTHCSCCPTCYQTKGLEICETLCEHADPPDDE